MIRENALPASPRHPLLILESDVVHRLAVSRVARLAGFEVDGASSIEHATSRLRERRYRLLVLGLGFADGGDGALLERLAAIDSDVPVLIIADDKVCTEPEALRICELFRRPVCRAYTRPVDPAVLLTCLDGVRRRLDVGLPPCGGCGQLKQPTPAPEVSGPRGRTVFERRRGLAAPWAV